MKRVVVAVACILLLNTTSFAEKVVVVPLGSVTNINASINWKGEWANGTDYLEGEAVS